MKRIHPIAIFLILLLILGGCAGFITGPDESPRFILKVAFNDNPSTLAKATLIDLAWVMVVDLNDKFESLTSFEQSQDVSDFYNAVYAVAQDTNSLIYTREGWKQFLGSRDLPVISDQTLEMDSTSAYGTVSGTLGLNWILIAFEQRGVIQYIGAKAVNAQEGAVDTVKIDVSYLGEG